MSKRIVCLASIISSYHLVMSVLLPGQRLAVNLTCPSSPPLIYS
jgi:hypothetical protein